MNNALGIIRDSGFIVWALWYHVIPWTSVLIASVSMGIGLSWFESFHDSIVKNILTNMFFTFLFLAVYLLAIGF